MSAAGTSAGLMAWSSWPAAPWRAASSPRPAGSPQLTVTVDLDTLVGHNPLGGDSAA